MTTKTQDPDETREDEIDEVDEEMGCGKKAERPRYRPVNMEQAREPKGSSKGGQFAPGSGGGGGGDGGEDPKRRALVSAAEKRIIAAMDEGKSPTDDDLYLVYGPAEGLPEASYDPMDPTTWAPKGSGGEDPKGRRSSISETGAANALKHALPPGGGPQQRTLRILGDRVSDEIAAHHPERVERLLGEMEKELDSLAEVPGRSHQMKEPREKIKDLRSQISRFDDFHAQEQAAKKPKPPQNDAPAKDVERHQKALGSLEKIAQDLPSKAQERIEDLLGDLEMAMDERDPKALRRAMADGQKVSDYLEGRIPRAQVQNVNRALQGIARATRGIWKHGAKKEEMSGSPFDSPATPDETDAAADTVAGPAYRKVSEDGEEEVSMSRRWLRFAAVTDAPVVSIPMEEEVSVGRYKALIDRESGRLTIYNVPIFVDCERDGIEFDRDWIRDAIFDLEAGARGGYFPPLAVQHHKRGGGDVKAAGVFRFRSASEEPYRGDEDDRRLTVFADLVITNPEVAADFLAGRLPYRSVEIFNVDARKIDVLTLLDHEPPYLELPLTADLGLDPESVEGWKFCADWDSCRIEDGTPVVAFSRRGRSWHVLLSDGDSGMGKNVKMQAEVEEAKEREEKEAGEHYEAAAEVAEASAEEAGEAPHAEPDGDEAPTAPPAEEPQSPVDELLSEGTNEVDGLIEQILNFKLTIEDVGRLRDALDAILSKLAPPEKEEVPEVEAEGVQPPDTMHQEGPPKTSATAPGEAMSRKGETTETEARLLARLDALEARDVERAKADEVREAVSAALSRLEGRALGADPETRFRTFAETHGIKAFSAYVDELAATVAMSRTDRFAQGPDVFDFGAKLPDEVLAYQKDGAKAMEAAAGHARAYADLKARGQARWSLEDFLRIQMTPLSQL